MTLENKKFEMIYEIEESICSSNRDKKVESIRSDDIMLSQDNINILHNNISRSQASLTLDELTNIKLKSNHFISCQTVKIYFTQNWGDYNYVGLTGIEFIDEKSNIISNDEITSFTTFPNDLNSAYGDCGDIRILENLFDTINKTNDISHMWLTMFNKDSPPYLEICFENTRLISGIRIWNYNKKFELERGVKSIEIQFDDHLFYESSIVIRKGIGEQGLDYSQTIVFPVEEMIFNEVELAPFKETKFAGMRLKQDFETPYLPTGFIYKLTIISNYGDNNLVGLNYIEFFNQNGVPILNLLNPRILSVPEGIKSFCQNDFNSPKSSNKYTKNALFISPYINTKLIDNIDCDQNTIFFIFDRPVSISFIQFGNYSKNPNSGIKEFLLSCDNNLIYKVKKNFNKFFREL